MIARESFEKSLPRFASAAPFLCLIDDHLLCPDKARLLEEELVQPRIVRQLRVDPRDDAAARLVEAVQAHQAREGRRLAAGDDQAVEARELVRLAHLDHLRAEAAQHRRVLAEVPLHGQNADSERLHGRKWYLCAVETLQ